MDNSSRNIVKFIATLTLAAMLIMAARYYAMSQEVDPPPVPEEVATMAKSPAENVATKAGEMPNETTEDQIIEEDYEIKMGEPSVDIGGDAPPVQAPAALSVPETVLTTEPQPAD